MYQIKVNNRLRSFGETDTQKKIIQINKKKSKHSKNKGELLDTIEHEFMHAKHPKMKEKNVVKKTAKATKKMSPKTKKKIYSKVK